MISRIREGCCFLNCVVSKIKTYNATPVIQGRDALTTGDWHDKLPTDRFFRAILNLDLP